MVSVNRIDLNRRYTLKDYLSWDTNERYELIDGVPYLLASPSPVHQTVVVNLASIIRQFLLASNRNCRVYVAPLDLLLDDDANHMDATNVFQPDVFVMCGKSNSIKQVSGVPEWIIEVLSPSTARLDQVEKLNHYQKAKVKEYWIVDPANQYVRVCILDEDRYTDSRIYQHGEKIQVSVFEQLEIDLNEVFEDEIAATQEEGF